MLSLKSETIPAEHSKRLTALVEIFSALNAQGVRYCHWKSNFRLEEALQGKTDFDLLVDPNHEDIFNRILKEWNVLQFRPAPGRSYPGIENHLGYDPASGKLFHFHVHYRLVLGEQFVKNYELPLEEEFLNSIQLRHGIRTPIPELEIIILSLRALLKYRDRDGLKDILSIRSSGLPHHIRKEIEWLLGQTTRESISLVLSTIATTVPSALVLEFLDTIALNPRSGFRLLRLRREVRRTLQPYQRQNRSTAIRKYFQEVWRRSELFKRPTTKRMTLSKGGVRVAFIGIDGAGKSSLIKELTEWLSWRLDVNTYYMGSSQPYRSTRIIKELSKFTHRVHTVFQHVFGNRSPVSRPAGSLSWLFANLRFLFEARDCYHRYRLSCKEAETGSLIFYDRYPLDSIRIFNRTMDGPRIVSKIGQPVDWITRVLSRAEQDLYRKIQPPDQVVLLKVSPEVSQARKPDHKWDLITAKNQAMRKISVNGFELFEVDAERPMDEVLKQIRPVIWRLLE